MKKTAIILLALLMLLASGCTERQDAEPHSPTVPKATEAPVQATETEPVTEAPVQATEAESVTQPIPTDAPEEAVDATTGATPTESGACIVCGAPEDNYDGYCYYCHPDFLFTCTRCGYEQPYHRTESGMCYECEAAVDADTGATPYGS